MYWLLRYSAATPSQSPNNTNILSKYAKMSGKCSERNVGVWGEWNDF